MSGKIDKAISDLAQSTQEPTVDDLIKFVSDDFDRDVQAIAEHASEYKQARSALAWILKTTKAKYSEDLEGADATSNEFQQIIQLIQNNKDEILNFLREAKARGDRDVIMKVVKLCVKNER